MSASRTVSTHHKWLSLNTIFLVAALILGIVALVYAVKNHREINNIESSNASTKSNFVSGGNSANSMINAGGAMANKPGLGTDYYAKLGNKVLDGNDASNKLYAGQAQSQCPPVAVAEPYHASLGAFSGAPQMGNVAATYASSYPDETAAQSLAGKTTYSCAPDVAAAGGCDYALNPDNLMPGSWREGVGCSDGVDPNSQWAKYHPSREKYYRYITAAGSARLGVITRSPMKKITGVQNFLRSSTSTPISPNTTIPFNDSSHRGEVAFNATGAYPMDNTC